MKQIFLFFLSILFTLNASSQYKVQVETGEMDMSKGKQLAFTVIIPESQPKEIELLWKRYVNNRTAGELLGNFATQIGNVFKSKENQSATKNLKVEKRGNELYVKSIEVSEISKYPLDVYALIKELPDSCELSAFFQFTDSIFIDQSNAGTDRVMAIKLYIHDFGVEAYKWVVDNQISKAKREVAKQEGLLKDIKSETSSAEKSILRYETSIGGYNSEIADIEREISLLDDNLALKKTSYSTLSDDTPEYAAAGKEIKSLEKEKSALEKSIQSLKGKIKSKESDIKSANKKISDNKTLDENQQKIIQEKEQIVNQLKVKKEGIF